MTAGTEMQGCVCPDLIFRSQTLLNFLQDATQQAAAFELIDALTSSAHTVVHMISESISCRIPGLSDKSRKQVINPNLSVPVTSGLVLY